MKTVKHYLPIIHFAWIQKIESHGRFLKNARISNNNIILEFDKYLDIRHFRNIKTTHVYKNGDLIIMNPPGVLNSAIILNQLLEYLVRGEI